MSSVYVTRDLPGDSLQRLSRLFPTTIHPHSTPPTRETLLRLARGRAAILCTLADRIDSEVIHAAGQNLRVISTYSTGTDHVDLAEATSRGIYVTHTSDILAESTADLAFGLLLAGSRRVVEGDKMVRARKWRIGWQPDLLMGFDVYGATLGIIGLGRIGTAMAKRARGFSMKVIYNSRHRKPEIEAAAGVEYRPLDSLLRESDFVTVHAASNESSIHLLNASNLRLMKKTAFLINTARGNVVDSEALIDALKRGLIAGACLDVFESEPLYKTSPLAKMSNVVLTPHIGSATHVTRERMAQAAVNSIVRVLRGEKPEPKYVANKILLSR